MKLTFMTIAHDGGRARFSSPVTPTQEHTDNNSSHIKIKPHKWLISGSNDNITNKGGNLNHNQDRISARYFVQHVGYVDF